MHTYVLDAQWANLSHEIFFKIRPPISLCIHIFMIFMIIDFFIFIFIINYDFVNVTKCASQKKKREIF